VNPPPPPLREYKLFTPVNEYKSVDWYTSMGLLFDDKYLCTTLPTTWFGRLFMSRDKKNLIVALERNREACGG